MIDLSVLSPTEVERFIHLQALIWRQEEAAAKVRAARAYYEGDHPVLLTRRQKEYLGAAMTEGEFAFQHNLIKPVIDTLRERLTVTGFTVNGEAAGDSSPAAQVAALLWDWWKSNKMNAQQIRLHRRTLRDGRSYVMVDYDNERGRPRLTLHETDDGTQGITFHRNPADENSPLFACRYFPTFNPLEPGKTGYQRKTVYLPHEIRKYEMAGSADPASVFGMMWKPVRDASDLSWPIPWRDLGGRALGLAVVEFQNPGGSEVNQIAGLQNALNKGWLDLLAAADTSGFPILTMNYRDGDATPTGDTDDEDIEGDDEFIVAPGRALDIFGGTIDRIPPADLKSMIDLVWTVVNAVAGVTRTPHQYLRPFLSADVPSGEALKQLESGLVSKAQERQLMFGDSWADVMTLAYRVARVYGRGVPDLGDEPDIAVEWADANTRMEKVEAEIAQIFQALGLPPAEVWAKLGFSPEQIAAFEERMRTKRAVDLATVTAAMRQAPTVTGGLRPVESAPVVGDAANLVTLLNGGNNGA